MKKILITTLLILLFSVASALAAFISPEDLLKKPLTVQNRANSWMLSTTYIKNIENQGVILSRENGIWNSADKYWLFNIDLEIVQPSIDLFEKTLKKSFDKNIPKEIRITIGFWLANKSIIVIFTKEEQNKEFYEYMLKKIQ